MSNQLDYLDQLALRAAKGDLEAVRGLSKGERVYVALAANSAVLLAQGGDTIAEALDRIGPEWTAALVERWRHRGDPAKLDS